jgi:colanic acid biosynthesis glycosyl transferase WcaI
LIVSNYYHPEFTGSAPPISDLSFWAAEQGLSPSVLTARPSYPLGRVYDGYENGQRDTEVYRGVNVKRVRSVVSKSRGTFGRLAAELSFVVSAVLTRRRRYRGVVCVCPSVFVVLAAPLFRRRGGTLVAIVHDIQSGLAQSLKFGVAGPIIHGLRWLEAWALNRCDSVVVLSEAMTSELRALGVVRPIEVIPPQVDVREITPTPEPETETPVLLYSGNLGRKQGLGQVLELARALLERGSPAVIHIRGQGSERVDLEAEAARIGLSNVRFSDLAPRDRLSDALGEATLHLVPQNPSGASFALPSKVFSIMAAQRAFVATAAPDTPLEQVAAQSGGGICVEADDPALFADAVEALLKDGARRAELARSGRRYVESEVDREIVCRRILERVVRDTTRHGVICRAVMVLT